MPERLIYVPIEAYKSRYTEYTSVAGGVYEHWFQAAEVPFIPIRPSNEVMQIENGIVLDYVKRTHWSFQQVLALIQLMKGGNVDPKRDAIYFEDFWTPGFEQIPYCQSLRYGYDRRKHIPVYSFCHAQSTDPYDFMHEMRWWARGMESSWGRYQDKIFCSSFEMIGQWTEAPEMPDGKLHPCGHAFSAEVLRSMYDIPEDVNKCEREPLVIYSARWDHEKNPWFFLDVADKMSYLRPEVKFAICTSLPVLTSNDPEALTQLDDYMEAHDNLTVYDGLSKKDYFQKLQGAKVQFNCASQDFVSYTLLDATLNGCAPLYPDRLTFPDALNRSVPNLYLGEFNSEEAVEDAVDKLSLLIDSPCTDYSWVWRKYESSVFRMLAEMGFNVPKVPTLEQLNKASLAQLLPLLDTVQI